MSEQQSFPRAEIEAFATQIAAWVEQLDPHAQAMVVDLLAKAGGDVFGHESANASGENDVAASSSETSPLELHDFGRAVLGIFSTAKPSGS